MHCRCNRFSELINYDLMNSSICLSTINWRDIKLGGPGPPCICLPLSFGFLPLFCFSCLLDPVAHPLLLFSLYFYALSGFFFFFTWYFYAFWICIFYQLATFQCTGKQKLLSEVVLKFEHKSYYSTWLLPAANNLYSVLRPPPTLCPITSQHHTF